MKGFFPSSNVSSLPLQSEYSLMVLKILTTIVSLAVLGFFFHNLKQVHISFLKKSVHFSYISVPIRTLCHHCKSD